MEQKRGTGEGGHVDVPLLCECVVHSMTTGVCMYRVNREMSAQ